MRVAFVGCKGTLTASSNRRIDAYEHDAEFRVLRPFFAERGDELIEVDWRKLDLAQPSFDLLFIRTVYDYTRHVGEFNKFLDTTAAQVSTANDPAIVRWNMDKHYLNELAGKGLPVIESRFIERPTKLAHLYAELRADDLVVKPTFGNSGLGQARYRKAESDPDTLIENGLFVQPFMSSVVNAGEISMIFIGGAFSHALIKQCGPGEYRVHKEYGGTEQPYKPSAAEIELAGQFIDALPARPLACRVDFIRDGKGLLLMELEAIEPFLFPHHEPAFCERVYAACKSFLE
jgi:glutathione synthase/RimK-type ligase-like ATP-grasp enzyme